MIGFAQEQDIQRLREIWKVCFGDPDSYLDFYFSRGFPLFRTVVDRKDGKITSMLTVVPAFYKTGGKYFEAAYLYAVGTAPEYRGKGIATRLLSETHEILRKEGVKFTALFPAESSLYGFYEKVGYQTAFTVNEVRLLRTDVKKAPSVSVRFCEKKMFLRESACFLERLSPVLGFQEKSLEYFYDEVLATEGQILWVDSETLQGYAVCYKIKGQAVLKETSLTRSQLEICGNTIMNFLGTESLFARTPTVSNDTAVRHGMLCTLDKELEGLVSKERSGYMNLILD